MPADNTEDPNITPEFVEKMNQVWDDQLRHTSTTLQRMSGASAVVVILVDAPWAAQPHGPALVSGIAGSRRASAELISSALCELAEQVDADAEKIRAQQPFVSDTSQPKEPLS